MEHINRFNFDDAGEEQPKRKGGKKRSRKGDKAIQALPLASQLFAEVLRLDHFAKGGAVKQLAVTGLMLELAQKHMREAEAADPRTAPEKGMVHMALKTLAEGLALICGVQQEVMRVAKEADGVDARMAAKDQEIAGLKKAVDDLLEIAAGRGTGAIQSM